MGYPIEYLSRVLAADRFAARAEFIADLAEEFVPHVDLDTLVTYVNNAEQRAFNEGGSSLREYARHIEIRKTRTQRTLIERVRRCAEEGGHEDGAHHNNEFT